MSRLLVSQYQAEVQKIIQFGGSRKETSIRVAFQNLLNEYCKPRDFLLIPELDYKLPNGKFVYPDGTVKDALRLDWGYWESKDQYDNLDQEIEKKLNKGYPDSNILFEDSQTAVLIQAGTENQRVSMQDAEALDGIITNFINYVRPEVKDFRSAIETFKQDLPTVLDSLRDLIDSQGKNNVSFEAARNKFWDICKESINPEISLFDIREMMIQHILTEDIFLNIFNESQFHRENNVARELQGVISTFFTGNLKRNTLGTIDRYYAVIRRTAANIYNHQEKQKFLKALYENFYKAYNPKAKDSYVKYSQANNNIVLYDMYTRFIRWASDRLGKNGIIAFICNSSFIDGITFDGFRKAVSDDFNYIYIIDLHGDVRKNPKLSGTTHNVFGIQTGVAIMFMVKKQNSDFNGCKIFYIRRPDFDTAEEKLRFLSHNKFSQIPFEHITPDKKHNWINQADNDFDTLLPLVDKDVKAGKKQEALFKLFTIGVVTNRDEWVYDISHLFLREKIKFMIGIYDSCLKDKFMDNSIKWSSSLEKYLESGKKVNFNKNLIQISLYRPYFKLFHYTEKIFNHRLTQNHYDIFSPDLKSENKIIAFSCVGSNKYFQCLASNLLVDLHLTGDSQCLPLYRYDKEGKRIDNITDWGLKQIQSHYQDKTITKIDIFHYTYAVLHNPEYRKKYELNLKRDFPRLPFYENFHQWVNWGKQLMELHINYERVAPYNLTRVDIPLKDYQKTPKPKLKADKTKGNIILDDVTTLQSIPSQAWEYMLGNRCALEWILDQYKEKKPKDPTIAEKFNTYRFADYKEQVIDLLMRVCTVSVETMKIINLMSSSQP
ncbi:type ISP restriction/modification enzyme [Nodularia spumigena]|uniref:type ISP restriction/modification enzyme n=1 Tax=Nodularia spumigena TaxID=70799 RepID=UPI002B20E477|nr:type ISP restriction/modification enzyme [Nodularia spumigena]MEA5559018.1 type ISP restriction/modification enzyme [Nodularia spumigena CH309]